MICIPDDDAGYPVLSYYDAVDAAFEFEEHAYTVDIPISPIVAQPDNLRPALLVNASYSGAGAPYVLGIWIRKEAAWEYGGFAVAIGGGSYHVWLCRSLWDFAVDSDGSYACLNYGYEQYGSDGYDTVILRTTGYIPPAWPFSGVYTVEATPLGTSTAYCMCIKGDDNIAWALWSDGTTLKVGPSAVAEEDIADEGGGTADQYAIASDGAGKLFVASAKSAVNIYERTGASTYVAHEVFGAASTDISMVVEADGTKHICYKNNDTYHYAKAAADSWEWSTSDPYDDTGYAYKRSTLTVRSDGRAELILTPRSASVNRNMALFVNGSGTSWTEYEIARIDGFAPQRAWAYTGYTYPVP